MPSTLRAFEILLVEDNPGDVRLIREALRAQRIYHELHVVETGVEALAFLKRRGRFVGAPRPDLILLDLSLPGRSGGEVLGDIKRDPDLRAIPVVVLTASRSEEDVARSYELQASCYVTKPMDAEQFMRAMKVLDNFWLVVVTLPPRRE
jgi:CheY-like chemotaxis protein